ncbi:MAG: hypothetical protein H7Y38_06075 [Armatimonadetes bacterium]|nr:hypothetical protein [Armatimonadota bacterium]
MGRVVYLFLSLVVANVSASLHSALFDVHAQRYAQMTKPTYPANLLIIGIDDVRIAFCGGGRRVAGRR